MNFTVFVGETEITSIKNNLCFDAESWIRGAEVFVWLCAKHQAIAYLEHGLA